jgi:surface antigen
LTLATATATGASYQVICSSAGFACTSGGYDGRNLGWPDRYYGQGWQAGLVHNCTRYAAFKLQQHGLGDPGTSFGNAYEWDDRIRSRYGAGAVDGVPAVGAIAQWNSFPGDGGFGHVAYVEEIGPDYIRVSDDSYGSGTRGRIIPAGTVYWPSNFIHIAQPPQNAAPFGYLDVAESPGPGLLHVAGWAADPDVRTSPIDVHVYANEIGFNLGSANRSRVDVGAALPGYGNEHGFDATVAVSAGGTYQVCAYGINVPAGGNPVLKNCKAVAIADPQPFGHLDEVTSPSPGLLRVRGWAVDPNTKTAPVDVHVYLGAKGFNIGKAEKSRADVGKALPGYGNNHGFDTTIRIPAGGQGKVCAYAINVGPGSNQQLKVCKEISVKPAPPTATPPPNGTPPTTPTTKPAPAGASAPTLKATIKRKSPRRITVSWQPVAAATSYRVALLREADNHTFQRKTTSTRVVLPVKRGSYSLTLTARNSTGKIARDFREFRIR